MPNATHPPPAPRAACRRAVVYFAWARACRAPHTTSLLTSALQTECHRASFHTVTFRLMLQPDQGRVIVWGAPAAQVERCDECSLDLSVAAPQCAAVAGGALCGRGATRSAAVQAGRGTTRKQLEWLILHSRLQYVADVLCSSELFPLAFDLASDPQLPIATGPVLLRWAQAVIDLLGTDRQACLAWLRKQLDHAPGVSWAAVAEYARVRTPTLRPIRRHRAALSTLSPSPLTMSLVGLYR